MDGYDEDLSIVCCNIGVEPDEEDLEFLNWIQKLLNN